jgi:fermentation-respiration switch protein FrsA (DUF1100 family)
MLTTLLPAIAVAYLLLLLVLRLAESRLLYAPGERRLESPPPGLPAERVEIPSTDGVRLVAWIIPADPPAAGARWLLICHGNAGNLSNVGRPAHYAGLRALGLNLLAFDYRGYGESGGKPSERGLYDDAGAAYRYLREVRRVPPERIVLFGHSLGSAVAVDLAVHEPAAGLVLDGALASVVGRAQEVYPYVPVRLVARSRFLSIEKIPHVRMPKLFLHARADEVIPFAHGRRLFEAATEPKTFVALRGGHGDAFEVDSDTYFGAIRGFVASLPPVAGERSGSP